MKSIFITIISFLVALAFFAACDSGKLENWVTPIQHAIMLGDNLELKTLLSNGSKQFSTHSKKISPPIFLAVDERNIEAISLLLEHGDDINRLDPHYGYRPIHRAVLNNRIDVLSYILENGVDIDSTADDGRTALMYACLGGKKETCEFLLSRGAGINIADKKGNTALFYAAYNDGMGCLNLLLSQGAELDIVDSLGDTVLAKYVSSGNTECVELLLGQGASPNIGSPAPLLQAILHNNVEMVQVLLSSKYININYLDQNGVTCLRHAKVRGYDEIAKLLEEKGAVEFIK